MQFIPKYKPVHTGISIVSREACADYREWSTVRDSKKISYYTEYRRVLRKVWKKIAEDSLIYESGVYAEKFFYLVPQVVDNQPFIELYNGKIKTNSHTEGNIYAPIFCNLFKRFDYNCWSLTGSYVESYKQRLNEIINKFVPKYYFILNIILNNKL